MGQICIHYTTLCRFPSIDTCVESKSHARAVGRTLGLAEYIVPFPSNEKHICKPAQKPDSADIKALDASGA